MAETAERVYSTRDDKHEWGDGPWLHEPDKVQWKDPATGLPCLVVRNHFGCWCGYVGVSEGHPAFEVGYDEVRVDVHGGLTFADHCHEGPEETSICHIPDPGEPDHVWWLGFDCGHSSDYNPRMEADYRQRFEETGDPLWQRLSSDRSPWNPTYKTLDYVRGEVANLAAQLAVMETADD